MPVEFNQQPIFQAVAAPVTGYALNQFDWSVVVPEGTKNYFINPSIEDANIGASFYTGSNVGVARVNTNAVIGLYTLQVTPTLAAASQVGFYAAGNMPAGPVTFSVFVKGAQGETMFISFKNVVGGGQVATSIFTATGETQRVSISGKTSDLTLSSGLPVLYVGKTTASTRPYYIEGLQLEPKQYATTYCDGSQKGCRWSGPANASTSFRPDNAGGGREYFLRNLGFLVTAISGHDSPPYEAQVQPYGLVGGQKYQRTIPRPQTIILSNVIEGNRYPVARKTKDKIVELLSPFSSQYMDRQLLLRGRLVDDCRSDDPQQLGPTLEMPCRMVGDLTGNNDNYNQERFALSFVCDNSPAIQAVYESAASIGYKSLLPGFTGRMTYFKATQAQPGLTATNLNRWQTPSSIAVGVAGLQTTAVATCQTTVPYPTNSAAVTFLGITDGTNSYIVDGPNMLYYLTIALNGTVNSMVFDNNGVLYAGGAWTAGAQPYSMKIAVGTGVASPLGTTNKPNAVVRALVAVPSQSVVYGFGDFTNSGTRWGIVAQAPNDLAWNNPTGGAGFNNTVRGALLLQNGKILVYGDFTSVDGVAYNRAVIFDPYTNNFSAVGKGFSNGSVRSAVQLPNGDIIFGGTFTTTGAGLTTNYVAIFNGSQILPLGNNSLTNTVNAVAFFDNAIYAVGPFNSVPDAFGRFVVCNGVAVLIGDYWVPPDITSNFDGTGAGGTFVGTGSGAIYISSTASFGAGYGAAITNVQYDGTADAYPTIVIRSTSTGTIFSIINQATGAALYFDNFAIQANETMTIVFSPTGLTATSNLYGDVSRLIMPNSDFNNFSLVKRNTKEAATDDYSNPIQVLGDQVSTVEVYWRNTFQGFSATATAAYNGL